MLGTASPMDIPRRATLTNWAMIVVYSSHFPLLSPCLSPPLQIYPKSICWYSNVETLTQNSQERHTGYVPHNTKFVHLKKLYHLVIITYVCMYCTSATSFYASILFEFLGKSPYFTLQIYICVVFIFVFMIVHSSLTYSVFAFLDPYLQCSPWNWHVGLSVGTVNGKIKKAKTHLKIFQWGFCCRME